MTNEQAKFILRAYRPTGQDATDPAFAEALAQAQRDPALRAWFEREQAFDALIEERLKTIAAPSGLREAILAGARASSRTPVRRYRSLAWMGAAAAVAALLTVLAWWRPTDSAVTPTISVDELARFALHELSGSHPRGQPMEELGEFGTWLTASDNRMGTGLPVELADLRARNCRSVTVAGREVFEICFRRGDWYHVYVAKRSDFGCQEAQDEPMFREQGQVASCTFINGDHVYVLVSRAGLAALKRVL